MNKLEGITRLGTLVIVTLLIAVLFYPMKSTAWETDTDRPGMDYKSFWIDKDTEPFVAVKQCEDACKKDPQCKAFTYVKPGVQGVHGRCYLKKGVPSPVKNTCCTSGVVRPATDVDKCKNYAATAVQQNQSNLDWKCGYSGPRWSSNYQAHYDWCMKVPKSSADSEETKRKDLLKTCWQPSTSVDIDIDSDNNNVFSEPDRSTVEDEMEDHLSKPGRIVVKNDDDNDGDQVPDFADGFNLDGVPDNEDDINSAQRFVPLVLEIPRHINLDKARIRIGYNVSNPADVKILRDEPLIYKPARGMIRIWAQPGDVERNAEHIAHGGDFVFPSEYAPEQLGLTNTDRVVTWYVEGIQKSLNLADQEIVIEVDPDGSGPAEYSGDIVRLTIVDMQLMTQGPNGDMVEQEFTYNSVPVPQIQITVQDWQIDESGMVTITINGRVADRTSDIVSDPNLQLQKITISAGNQPGNTIDLFNSAKPEYPWQPYRFQSSFSTTIQLQTHPVHHEYYIFLETSENAAGVAGQLNLVVFRNGSDIRVVREAENDPGTYMPTIMRVDAPEGTFARGEDEIYVFDHGWPIDYRDLGDGEYYWYAMGSQDNVQILLPALYASDGVPVIKAIEEGLVALIKKNGQTVSFREAAKIHGLIIDNESVKSYLDLSIMNFTEEVYNWGNVKKYVYRPRTGWAKKKNKSLETEIKFRYVNHADTISGAFKNKKQFQGHIKIREATVKAARDVKLWGNSWKENAYWTKGATVKSGKKACDAIAHAFNNQNEYGMGCLMAAILVMERGMCLVNANGFNTLVGSYPFGSYSKVITREGRPAKGASILLKDKVKWIPGDWGYILNPDPKAWEVVCTNHSCKHKWTVLYGASKTCPKCGSLGEMQGLLQGENIIYLGGPNQGPGKPAIGNFELLDEIKFKNSAYFWGHIHPREETLQDWYNEVNKWSSQKAKIFDTRDRAKY